MQTFEILAQTNKKPAFYNINGNALKQWHAKWVSNNLIWIWCESTKSWEKRDYF